MKKKFAAVLALAMLLCAGGATAAEQLHDISTGSLTIGSCGEACPGHRITGTTNEHTISVTEGTHDVTLDGVTIDVSGKDKACAFSIPASAVNLTLAGDNVLKSGRYAAGVYVGRKDLPGWEGCPDAELTITEGSTGSLTVAGGFQGAGIGGLGTNLYHETDSGKITINGGRIHATAGRYGAGIGGGQYGRITEITINGGTVYATGESEPGYGRGAGIGSGESEAAEGTITINGGTVTAIGGNYAAGIGSGYYAKERGPGAAVIINGGLVYAIAGSPDKYGYGGGGIGSGDYGGDAQGTLTIRGGTVYSTSAYRSNHAEVHVEPEANQAIRVKMGKTMSEMRADQGTDYTDDKTLTWVDLQRNLYFHTYDAGKEPLLYWVLFDQNGGDGGSMAEMLFTNDEHKNLTKNAFTRTGYTFNQWNTKPDGAGTFYADGQRVGSLTETRDAAVTLYAQWTPHTYRVQFHMNDGAQPPVTAEQTGFVYDEAKNLAAKPDTFVREGYRFMGWNTNRGGKGTAYADGASVKNLTAENNGTAVLYAQWKPLYSIRFDANGGQGTMEEIKDIFFDTRVSLNGGFTRENYRFVGWNTQPDGSGAAYETGRTYTGLTDVPGATVTLYAQWKPLYSIHFDANGGQGTMADIEDIFFDTQVSLSCGFTRCGYSLTGWNTQPDGSGAAYETDGTYAGLTDVPGATVTLYAQWKPLYSIHFDANGGAGTMADIEDIFFDTQVSLSCGFTRYGYSLTGWNTQPDGSGAAYADQGTYTHLTDVPGATVTLYAQWKKLPVDGDGKDGEKFDTETRIVVEPLRADHLTMLPGSLKTPAGVEALMRGRAVDSGFILRPEEAHIGLNDVRMQYREKANKRGWIDVTAENFPAEGITVRLEVPAGADVRQHEFFIVHVFTQAANGHQPGESELLTPTIETDAKTGKSWLTVTMHGCSPVGVLWREKPRLDLPGTGDASMLGAWVTLLGMAGMGLKAMKKKK